MNDMTRIITDLERQRGAIDKAIAVLREISDTPQTTPSRSTGATKKTVTKKRGPLSPEGRQRIIEAAKRRWAAVKNAKNDAATKKAHASKKTVVKKTVGKKVAAKKTTAAAVAEA